MAQRKKINWILILQGWAMLWVVIGHAFLGKAGKGPEWENMLFHFAYSFHMPLFMFVSGFLFYMTRLSSTRPTGGGNYLSYYDIIKDKAKRLLIPGMVFSIIALLVKHAFPGEMSRRPGYTFQDIVDSYLNPVENAFVELWFIVTLFIFFLFSPLWKKVIQRNWTIWMMLLILIIMHFKHPTSHLFCIDRVCSYAIWFFVGILLSRMKSAEEVIIHRTWIVLLGGILIYYVGYYIHTVLMTIGGITFSIALAMLLDRYIPKIFFTFRNYTYQIFLIGIFPQMAVKIAHRHVSVPYIATFIVCILLGLYVPVVVSKILEKFNWAPLLYCVGLKKKSR